MNVVVVKINEIVLMKADCIKKYIYTVPVHTLSKIRKREFFMIIFVT